MTILIKEVTVATFFYNGATAPLWAKTLLSGIHDHTQCEEMKSPTSPQGTVPTVCSN